MGGGAEAAARAALDAALHDWIGRRLGVPLWRLLGLSRDLPPTSYTIGIDSLEGTRDRARRAREYRVLKVKVGGAEDLERLAAVREESPVALRVDANEGWTLESARELLPALVELGVELIEQPFPADDLDSFRALRELRPRPPIVVDEGCHDLRDVAAVAGYADAVNVKLAKAGGVREAVRMIHAARALGLGVMLGCMVESQLAVAPAAHIGSLADWVDLDGHLLLADQPYVGLEIRDGRVLPSERARASGWSRRERAAGHLRRGPLREPQRQDRSRRDPVRQPRRGRGGGLHQRRADRRRDRALLRARSARGGRRGRGDRAGRHDAPDRGGARPAASSTRPGARRCSRRSRRASTWRRGCTPSCPPIPSCARRPSAAERALRDLRAAPPDLTVPLGPASRAAGVRVVHSVGSDTVIGKKVVTLELDRAARERGLASVYVPTGQTGVAIAGWGLAVDHVISDYVAGAAERLVNQGSERGDLLFVEGQGAIFHPAYSGVTLGLLHGSAPDVLVLVHKAGATALRNYPDLPLPSLPELVSAYEAIARPVRPARVAAIALNTSTLDEDAARAAVTGARGPRGCRPTTWCASAPSGCWTRSWQRCRRFRSSNNSTPEHRASACGARTVTDAGAQAHRPGQTVATSTKGRAQPPIFGHSVPGRTSRPGRA